MRNIPYNHKIRNPYTHIQRSVLCVSVTNRVVARHISAAHRQVFSLCYKQVMDYVEQYRDCLAPNPKWRVEFNVADLLIAAIALGGGTLVCVNLLASMNVLH